MRAFLYSTVAVIIPLAISPASALDAEFQQVLTKAGNHFKQGCSEYVSGNMTPAAWECFVRVQTFIDAVGLHSLTPAQTGYCKPSGTSYADLVRAVNANTYRVPSDFGPSGIIQDALRLAYPCQGSR